jgi:hypothetical protein
MFKRFVKSVGGVAALKSVIDARFACDLDACKGACCTFESAYGAPLLEEEVEPMREALPATMKYLPPEHVREIERGGFFERKESELMTRSRDRRACVFVYYDETGVAKCALEKAYFAGETTFRKPISCHLFPIRISSFGGDVLRFEKFRECDAAEEKGRRENVRLVDFAREALERRYGAKWFEEFRSKADE